MNEKFEIFLSSELKKKNKEAYHTKNFSLVSGAKNLEFTYTAFSLSTIPRKNMALYNFYQLSKPDFILFMPEYYWMKKQAQIVLAV